MQQLIINILFPGSSFTGEFSEAAKSTHLHFFPLLERITQSQATIRNSCLTFLPIFL